MGKRKNRKFKVLLIIISIFAVTVAVTYSFVLKPKIFVPGYEIFIPRNYTVHGIDVSHHQSNINWTDVSKMESGRIRIDFVIIKATEGSNWKDVNFEKNWKRIKQNHLTRGAYHYFKPRPSAREQANNYIRTARLTSGDIPPVIDVEESGNLTAKALRQKVLVWLNIVEKKFDVTPIIYTDISHYNKYFSKGFEKYPIWIAHYYKARKPRIDREWIFWQHSKKGKINGIKGNVDFNVFYGTKDQFDQILLP